MRKTLLLLVSTSAVTRAFSSIPGCSVGEDELRQKRVQTLLALDSAITSSTTSTTFSFDSFLKDLSAVFTLDTTYDLPNGVGPYEGLTDSAEYWALSFPAVNGNLFSTDVANVRDQALSIDGDVWTALSTTPMTWFPTVTPSLQTLYKGVTVATFAPCRCPQGRIATCACVWVRHTHTHHTQARPLSPELTCGVHVWRSTVRRSTTSDSRATLRLLTLPATWRGPPSTRPTREVQIYRHL